MRHNGFILIAFAIVSLTIGCGPSTKDLQVRDARIASLESGSAEQLQLLEERARELEECQRDRDNLGQLVTACSAESTQSKSQIERMKQALADARKREQQAQERIATFRSMLGQLKSMIDSGKLRVRIVRNRMVVELREAVLFDSGKAELSKEGNQLLAELAPVLSGVKKREFQVGGHTDNVPIRTARFPSNWELSAARSVNVLKLLVENGLSVTRVSAAAYADTQPVADNETKEGRAQNRRIEIALLPNLDELPDLSSLEGVTK